MNDQNNFNNNIYNSQGAHQGCAPVSNSNSNFNSNMQNNNLNNYQTYQNSGSVQSNNNGFINQNVSQTTDVSSNYLNANNVQGNGVVNNNSNVINVNNIMKSLDNNVYEEDAEIMVQLFHSYQECEPYIDSDKFRDLKEEVFHFIEDIYFHRENLLINVQTHLLKKYKDKDAIRLFLNMLVLGMRDLFHVKHSMNITYKSLHELFSKIEDSDDNIIRIIELILETEYLLNTNANVLLLMDSMIYRI